MSNKFVAFLAVVIIVVGGYTVATIYSKLSGRPVIRIFECDKIIEMTFWCGAQRDANDLLTIILPDKNSNLIKKFSPTAPSDL